MLGGVGRLVGWFVFVFFLTQTLVCVASVASGEKELRGNYCECCKDPETDKGPALCFVLFYALCFALRLLAFPCAQVKDRNGLRACVAGRWRAVRNRGYVAIWDKRRFRCI